MRRVWLFWVLGALQVVDVATTALAINGAGGTEGNASARAAMERFGQPAVYGCKLVVVGLLIFVLWRWRHTFWSRTVVWSAVVLMTLADANNVGYLASSSWS